MCGFTKVTAFAAFTKIGEYDAVAHTCAHEHGRDKAHTVEAVVEGVGHAARLQSEFMVKMDDQRQHQEALDDGAAVGAVRLRALHVHMHPVRIERSIGERRHLLLSQRYPVGYADFLADKISGRFNGKFDHGPASFFDTRLFSCKQ